MKTIKDDFIVNENEAAELLNVSKRTLQSWRVSGTGPKFLCYSMRCFRYSIYDLAEWLESRRVRKSSEISETVRKNRRMPNVKSKSA